MKAATTEYRAEDVLGQAAMTEAMFNWLEDDAALHPLNLDAALRDFEVILALYSSAHKHAVVEPPITPEAELIQKLRDTL